MVSAGADFVIIRIFHITPESRFCYNAENYSISLLYIEESEHYMNFQNKLSFLVFVVISTFYNTVQASDEPVEFLGDYSNVKSATGEHCEGYDVMLWKHKGSLVGFLNHHRGLCGDPPMGVMEETLYSAQTGSISFKAKLSDGCTFQAGECIPTKDRVEFRGIYRGEILEGVVTWFREDKMQPTLSENVIMSKNLKRSRTQSFETYAAWMKYWEPTLKVRGPQW